jgi:hypothetical protein
VPVPLLRIYSSDSQGIQQQLHQEFSVSLLPTLPPAILALADGTIFRGQAIGAGGSTSGEVVFNTAMTGYQEILTDPSYCRQIVTLTCPHIGNVGCNAEDFESAGNHAPVWSFVTCRFAPRAGGCRKPCPSICRGTASWQSRHRHPQAHSHAA